MMVSYIKIKIIQILFWELKVLQIFVFQKNIQSITISRLCWIKFLRKVPKRVSMYFSNIYATFIYVNISTTACSKCFGKIIFDNNRLIISFTGRKLKVKEGTKHYTFTKIWSFWKTGFFWKIVSYISFLTLKSFF